VRRPTRADLNAAQRQDNVELQQFMSEVKALVSEIANLDTQVESDVILKLKSRTDRAYEQCTGLPGNQTEVKQALNRLMDVMMKAISKEAQHDAKAMEELQKERVAREMHYSLLEYPLTGDLLRRDSPIEGEDLVPTLLSEPPETLRPILGLFAQEQLEMIRDAGRRLIENRKKEGHDLREAEKRLLEIESYLRANVTSPALN